MVSVKPNSFGVAAFDESENLIEVIEKPKTHLPILQLLDSLNFPKSFLEIEKLKFSNRGEQNI